LANPSTHGTFSLQYTGFSGQGDPIMLWTIFAILLVLWLLGFSFHIAGSLIHILLVIAIIVAVINLVGGRRAV
jgi:hypothetical protein